jgi:hypothetical protein
MEIRNVKENTVKMLCISIQCKKQFLISTLLCMKFIILSFTKVFITYMVLEKIKLTVNHIPTFWLLLLTPTYPHPLDI